MLLELGKELIEIKEVDLLRDEHPLDPAYSQALRLVLLGNIEASMDGLLDILREEKHYRDGAARKTMIALLELLGNESPVTRSYRAELASVLF